MFQIIGKARVFARNTGFVHFSQKQGKRRSAFAGSLMDFTFSVAGKLFAALGTRKRDSLDKKAAGYIVKLLVVQFDLVPSHDDLLRFYSTASCFSKRAAVISAFRKSHTRALR